MKKRLFVISLLILLPLVSCNQPTKPTSSKLEDYYCKDTPFKDGCFVKIDGPSYQTEQEFEEFTFSETFKDDSVNAQPFSWLLYQSDTYRTGSVAARVKDSSQVNFNIPTSNRVLELYSKGIDGPLYYPMNLSLIFTREFNLDLTNKGVAEATVLIPENDGNEFNFELVTGSVNVVGIKINSDGDGSVNVRSGEVFYYYQGNFVDQKTTIKLVKNTWYTFRLEWDGNEDQVKALMYNNQDGSLITLYQNSYHQSARFNAERKGQPISPNHVRLSMPKNGLKTGYAYVDNVKVAVNIDPSSFVNPNLGGENHG